MKTTTKQVINASTDTAKTLGLTLGGHIAGAALLGRYSTLAGIPVHIFAQMKGGKLEWLKYFSLGMITAVGFSRPAEGTNGLGEMIDTYEAGNMGMAGGSFSVNEYQKGVKARLSNHWSNFRRNLAPWEASKSSGTDMSGLGELTEFENPFGEINDADLRRMDGMGDALLEPDILTGLGGVRMDPQGQIMMGLDATGSII